MNTLQLGKVSSKCQQRGVMTILAALTLTTLIAFLALVVDTGRLYLEKRTLQKNADLAAIETALLYCRDQELDEAGRRAIALDALSASRNNFLGEEGGIIVKLGLVGASTDENGANRKSFTEDNSGKAIQVTLSRTVPASLFESFSFGGNNTVTLSRTAVAQACQPEALITIDSGIVNIDSSQSALLNTVLGGFLGSTVSLSVGEWNGLLTSDINLLSYLDALAIDLGVAVGSYDEVLSTSASLGDFLAVAADVLTADGNIIAANGLQALVLAIPLTTPAIQLGELISVQSGAPDVAFDIAISALDLTQASIQLANTKNALVANIPVSLLGVAGATIHLKVLEEPKIYAIGNPEDAKSDPYGSDQIYVRSAQVRSFISLDLPVAGATLSALEALLSNPLVAGVTSSVNSLLALDLAGVLSDLTCLLSCSQEKDITHIQILPTPRLDIAIDIGRAEARVSDYSCADNGDKSLTVPAQSAVAGIAAGTMGTSTADASNNAFSTAGVNVDPLALIDIGSKHIRKRCVLAICTIDYKKGTGWTTNSALADRTAYTGGGIGLKVDTNLLTGTDTLNYYNIPADTFLPNIDQTLDADAFQQLAASDLVAGVSDSLSGIELEFYPPSGAGIGGSNLGEVTTLVGSVADTLLASIDSIITGVLAPILDPLLNDLLDLLGVSLAETNVGSALTCESNKVELVI